MKIRKKELKFQPVKLRVLWDRSPVTRIKPSDKLYNRKRDKRRGDDE